MQVDILKVGILQENTYILSIDDKVIVIDPGDETDKILENIKYPVVGILVTHHHFDHIGSLVTLSNKTNAKIYDSKNLKEGKNNIDIFCFEVIYTPGHTSDSLSYYFYKENIMFTGDFIFAGSIGRTDLGGNSNDMKNSINKIKKYSDNIKIYPGHGDTTSLIDEKANNVYFNV